MNIPHMKCPEKIGRIDPDKTEHKLTRYLLVTCIGGDPIGFVTWDPRNCPEYVEIGHNGAFLDTPFGKKWYGVSPVPLNRR